MNFAALASRRGEGCTIYVGESCEENKNDPIPCVALSQKAELFRHTLHSDHDGELFAGAAFRFFSLSPSFFFFFLLSSSLCVFQNSIWGRARQDGSHTDDMEGILGQFASCGRV